LRALNLPEPGSVSILAGHARHSLVALCRVGGKPEQPEEATDLVAVLGGVPEHRRLIVDDMAVAPPLSFAFEIAGLDEVGQDSLRRTDGDPDGIGDIADAQVRVVSDAEQDLRVICHELPAAGLIA
jgi:hypothetical protein